MATLSLLFGILLAQTPSDDHTADLVVFIVAGSLALLGVLAAWLRRLSSTAMGGQPQDLAAPVILVLELALCVIVTVDILKHLHTP